MTLLPARASRAAVEAELPAVEAWAARHGWVIAHDLDGLRLRAATYHRPVRRLVEVIGDVTGYPAVPPAWYFVAIGTDETTKPHFPAPGPTSIFHSNPVICAPWNRLAYTEHGGPHSDWSGPAAWLQVRNQTTAHRLADMLAVIDANLRASPGMMV